VLVSAFLALAAGTRSVGTAGALDDRPLTVVVLGSSTAAGKNIDQPMHGGRSGGLADTWSSKYAAYLSKHRPGSRLVNLAKPGYSTYHALPTGTKNRSGYPAVDKKRNVTAALAEKADVIIVQFPGNQELGLGDTVQNIIDNYKAIANAAAAGGAQTWIASTQPTPRATPADIKAGLSLRRATVAEFGVHSLDFWAVLARPDNTADRALFLKDNTHPNATGHAALYDVLVAADIPGALPSVARRVALDASR
jgi:lysophospholipase L1-like esterase